MSMIDLSTSVESSTSPFACSRYASMFFLDPFGFSSPAQLLVYAVLLAD